MFPCVVVGDSIAVGVGQFRPDCETTAKVGITSERYIAALLPSVTTPSDTAVISLGVNDDDSVNTLGNLRIVRARFAGKTVYWLLPGLKDSVRGMIRTVAAENGDRLIDTKPQAGPDHLHPTGQGYRYLASRIEGGAEEYAALPAANPAERHRAQFFGLLTPVQRIQHLRLLRQHSGPVFRHGRIERPGEPMTGLPAHRLSAHHAPLHQADRLAGKPAAGHAASGRMGHRQGMAANMRRCADAARGCRADHPARG